MKIYGIITDAAEEKPLAKSKVVLYIGEIELVTFYSDKEGKFEVEQKLDQHIGETLICHVEKDNFKPREVTYKIEDEDIRLDIELVPIEREKPVELPKEEIVPPPSPPPPSNMKWLKIAIAVGALIVAGIVVYFLIPGERVIEKPEIIIPGERVIEKLEIISFDANPSQIMKGKSSTLSWRTSNAEEVRIRDIGKVSLSGSRRVSPRETTTYTLMARNEEGKVAEKRVRVSVIAPSEFRVTKASLEAIPDRYEGSCPKTVIFKGRITANGKGIVKYEFVRSDGAKARVQSLNFHAAGSKDVSTTWQLGRSYSGWQAIRILSPQKMESNRARFQVRCQIKEDCVGFNWRNVTVKKINGRWKVVEGNHWIMDFENKEAEARQALRIIKHYQLDQMCFVGRPKPSMTYFLSHDNAPSGSMPGEDCISFNINKIEVKKFGNRWKIVEGSHYIMDFGSNEAEARQAYQIIKKYGFKSTCYVGRPGPSMTYMRR